MASETVLVVDDTKDNLEFVVEYILQPNGFGSLTASNGQEGLQLAARHLPDLILLDLQMPKMNGRQMLEAMAARELDIPVVLMTFHGSEEIAIEMFRMGVKDYVKKPYSVEEMLSVINRSLSEVRLRKEKDALMERMLQANQELQRRVQELNTLYKVGKTVAASTDLDKLLPQMVDAALQVTNAQEGRVMLVNGMDLVCRAERNQNSPKTEMADYIFNDPAAQHVVSNNKGMIARRDQYGDYDRPPFSAAYAPLLLRGEVTGVLMVSNMTEEAGELNRNDTALLSALSDYAAIAIENLHQQATASLVPSTTGPSDETVRVGGVRQEVTVLFVDVRGQVTATESVIPEKIVAMLHNYNTAATALIEHKGGTLERFFGDGQMAIFNAPQRQKNHVYMAIETAQALLREAQDLNQRKGYNLSYQIGIQVGDAVVGYMGASKRLRYTAIGQVVNIARQLQEHAAPGQVLIAQDAAEHVQGQVSLKPVGKLKLRQSKSPLKVYTLQD